MNFKEKWLSLFEEDEKKLLFRTGEHEGPEGYSVFRVGSFLRRAQRFSNALSSDLLLEEGDHVALFLDHGSSLALALHGLWLSGLVAVPLDVSLDDSTVISICNNCEVKAVIFSPAAAAKVASIYPKLASVEHWLVTGGSRSFGPEKHTRTVDEIILSAEEGNIGQLKDSDKDYEALVVLASGKGGFRQYGAMFTQSQLLAAGKAQSFMYRGATDKERDIWCALPAYDICAIVCSQITPLFSELQTRSRPEFEAREFWQVVRQGTIAYALINQEQLRSLYKRAKGRDWAQPEDFSIYLVSEELVDSELLKAFENRFNVRVNPCYSSTEAGGIVAAFPEGLDTKSRRKLLYGSDFVSSGAPLPGNVVKISDSTEESETLGMEGQILVKSSQLMSYYCASEPGEAYITHENFLNTGDRGFLFVGGDGEPHLMVTNKVSS